MMALGFFGMPQDPLGPNISRIQSGVQKAGGGGFGVPPPSGPNFQLGQQGWQQGYGIGLPTGSGDHMPLVSSPASRPPPRQAMAPGQPINRLQQPPQQNPGGGRSVADEPWAQPGWQQPAPTYNDPAWGSNAIGWRGNGNAPPMPQVDPIGSNGAIGLLPPPASPVAAGSPGSNFMGAGMPQGQWQSVIQALSGLGSNMFQTPPPGGGGYANPNFLNMLMTGLGGYQ